MSKLSSDEKFVDVSDYGRPFARAFVNRVQHTSITPVQVTYLFGISGLIAIYCILNSHYFTAGLFLIIKSILDAADGELARTKNRPSYTGRYLDSIFDIFLNFLFLAAIWYVTDSSIWITLLAFISIQIQGTLYNYYYVILRHNTEGGERTSKIIENERPKAFPIENQSTVDFLYDTYNILYGAFDKLIFKLDKNASDAPAFPKWFMSMISIYGLGFQLLLISVLLSIGLIKFIIPFFIGYNVFLLVFIGIRKVFLNSK
ncbi:CDP-alcohol phosphatidyltransferase family protein [Belliella aquatica]|uniref:CDP-alcohol phosphatidyltransferase n=1 Tax=Belliella aquatica TaxID=1323734 RepID=A0ABQ1MU68_9BACT|nr:CDP-alcohol phosphatidyltransferase family protein [Belliella aquatica]MCH7406546.1 CDP-alcohol phosphatidyltransferase family protein [Belliella aquatica]GGC46829.1 CDP-alcohol phosphatidyltransferase [Belliella aquatica]